MSFSDDSRIVVKEGQPPPPPPPSRPASSKGETRKSTTTQGSVPAVGLSTRGLNGGKGKPDGFGTVMCVHTFPTGLVVSTGSGGTVSREGGRSWSHQGRWHAFGWTGTRDWWCDISACWQQQYCLGNCCHKTRPVDKQHL